jgi:acetyltransferase-like isoleucine patch superfamily enzyme
VIRGTFVRPCWRDVLFVLVFLAPPAGKKLLLRLFCRARVAPSAHIGWFSAIIGGRIELGEHSRVGAFTLIRCSGVVRLDAHAEVSSFVLCYGMGSFRLGRHSYVGPQSLVNADEDVVIGSLSALGPRCMLFTHGSFLPVTEGYPARLARVTVGDRAWLAAGVFLHPGVQVGDDVIVNSRSVVGQDVPSGCVAEGVPARPIHAIAALRRHMTPARRDDLTRRILERFAQAELRRELGVQVETSGPLLRFRYRRRSYVVVRDAPDATEPLSPGDAAGRVILVRVRAAGAAPTPPSWTVVDLERMRTDLPTDPIHARLVGFMRRYYGIHLDYGPPDPSASAAASADDLSVAPGELAGSPGGPRPR